MTVSLTIGIKLVCECLEMAMASLQSKDRQDALHLIRIARKHLQELEIDLKAQIDANLP